MQTSLYDSFSREWDSTRKNAWQEFEFARDFLNSKKLLDAGCGNGRLNFWLQKNNFRGEYLGIDSSANLIALARQNFPDRKFETQNLLDFRKPNSADAIFCVAVFHHLSDSRDRQKVLANFHSNLNSGGRLFFTVWNLWQLRFWKYFLRQFSRDLTIPFAKKSSRHVHAFTKHELKKLLTTAGFKKVKIFYAQHSAKSNFLHARNLIVLAEK